MMGKAWKKRSAAATLGGAEVLGDALCYMYGSISIETSALLRLSTHPEYSAGRQ